MTILNRYVVITIIKFFAMALAMVLGMIIVIDYLTNMDEFIKSQVRAWRALQYVLLKLPFISTQLIPVIFLMAILIAFGLMSKHNELMILNAGGISIYSLLKPVLVISMGVGLLLFFLAETVTPPTILKANEIDAREIRKTEGASLKRENIWFKGERQITHIAFFHPSGRTAFGYTRYHFDNAFQLIRRVDAKRLELVDGQWILYDGMQQTMNKDTGDLRVEVFTQQKEELNLKPSQFRKMAHRPEEMSMHRLAEYIERVEREGYDAQAYRVDLIHKTAYPFTGLVMGIIGMGLTARRKPVQGLPMAVSIGIAIAFLYWVFQGVCLSLGYGGVLPAAIAAWGANLVFLGGGTLLLINAE